MTAVAAPVGAPVTAVAAAVADPSAPVTTGVTTRAWPARAILRNGPSRPASPLPAASLLVMEASR